MSTITSISFTPSDRYVTIKFKDRPIGHISFSYKEFAEIIASAYDPVDCELEYLIQKQIMKSINQKRGLK